MHNKHQYTHEVMSGTLMHIWVHKVYFLVVVVLMHNVKLL